MRYRLRTLLIVLAIGPPVLAGIYFYPGPALVVVVSLWLIAAHFLEIGLRTHLADEKRRRSETAPERRPFSN